jgi:hypothetical protein
MATNPSEEAMARDDDATVAGLKNILKPYMHRTYVVSDDENGCYLEANEITYKGRRLFLAAVRRGKAYVSYHLIPLYMCPDLTKGMSPALRKRMQGKTCFNFTQPDAELFAELARLTAAGFERIEKNGIPQPKSLGKHTSQKSAKTRAR